jgi:hypothetical protein
MPVVLPPEESAEQRPSPPRLSVWLSLLILTEAVGVAITLLTWPKGEPTGTVRFWFQLVAVPFLVWAVGLGLRTLYYEQENERIGAENDALREDRERAIQFASDPLAVVGYAYLTGAGNSDVTTILARQAAEQNSDLSFDDVDAARYRTLGVVGDDEDPTRHRACFRELIGAVAEAVRVIPRDVPFGVRLQLPDDADHEALLKKWDACWSAEGLRAAKTVRVAPDKGVMELDEWLDKRGGPNLEKFLLFVTVQLHEASAPSDAEGAVALVLGWAPLAKRRGIQSIAHLHRPVEVETDSIGVSISTALRWGRTTGEKVKDLWQAGLEKADKVSITKSLTDLSIGVAETKRLSGVHDVDSVLGHSGTATGWLALAFGIERATRNNEPQLVAWRENTLRFATVQPLV